MSGIRSITLGDPARAPVMTIAMFHEVRDAQDRLGAQMIRARRGMGAVLALNERVAHDPLAAWHTLRQPGGLSGMGR